MPDHYVGRVDIDVPPGRRIFVSGTWSAEKAAPYADAAFAIGAAIGRAGLDVACGPGSGIAAHVVDGFRSVDAQGHVDFFLPSEQSMVEIGEVVGRVPDRFIHTGLDYPMRNVFQVKNCLGLIAVMGGDGTLEEILPALIDYKVPVGLLAGAGSASRVIDALSSSEFPEWQDLLFISTDYDLIASTIIETVLAIGRDKNNL